MAARRAFAWHRFSRSARLHSCPRNSARRRLMSPHGQRSGLRGRPGPACGVCRLPAMEAAAERISVAGWNCPQARRIQCRVLRFISLSIVNPVRFNVKPRVGRPGLGGPLWSAPRTGPPPALARARCDRIGPWQRRLHLRRRRQPRRQHQYRRHRPALQPGGRASVATRSRRRDARNGGWPEKHRRGTERLGASRGPAQQRDPPRGPIPQTRGAVYRQGFPTCVVLHRTGL